MSKSPIDEKKKPNHLSTFSGRSLPNDGDFSNLWGLDNQGQTINRLTGTVDADIDFPEAMAYASGRLSSTGCV